jgi:DNA-binding protein
MDNKEKIRLAINQIPINNCDGSANEDAIKAVRYLQEVSEAINYTQIMSKKISKQISITKIRLRSVKAEKRKFGISVIDLTDEVKYLRLMVVQLYFFSFGISYLLNEG